MSAPSETGAVTVVPAVPDDVDAILALDGLGASTRALLARDLQTDNRRCVVARRAGRVVGMAIGLVAAGEAHLLDVAVDPSLRGRGIGGQLVAALRARLQDLGATAMTLEVRASNVAARALYRRLGFEEAGERPGYYPDGGPEGGRETAVIMWDRDL